MYFGTDDEDLIPTQMQGDEIGTEQEESIPMQMESDEIGTEQVHAISIFGEDEDTSVDTTNNRNVINLSISKEVIPEVGKKFETEEAAYQFYNAYAFKVGFSVRKSNKHKDRSGKITDRVFCCSCQGSLNLARLSLLQFESCGLTTPSISQLHQFGQAYFRFTSGVAAALAASGCCYISCINVSLCCCHQGVK
ncbi:hypothetical protein Vadar_014728 [Vaccinium darrowii]|uniref:Uncharacterized protein n=1 Tax=Vaccinium darrowii TaxID=229202 RepID=A0ACB7XA77_9ERIC|nr:hypothetical protein Vadar_014728 [Vaccinium darrowii]